MVVGVARPARAVGAVAVGVARVVGVREDGELEGVRRLAVARLRRAARVDQQLDGVGLPVGDALRGRHRVRLEVVLDVDQEVQVVAVAGDLGVRAAGRAGGGGGPAVDARAGCSCGCCRRAPTCARRPAPRRCTRRCPPRRRAPARSRRPGSTSWARSTSAASRSPSRRRDDVVIVTSRVVDWASAPGAGARAASRWCRCWTRRSSPSCPRPARAGRTACSPRRRSCRPAAVRLTVARLRRSSTSCARRPGTRDASRRRPSTGSPPSG